LRHTPRLYGVNWDAFAIVENVDEIARKLEADPEVEAVSRGTFFPPQRTTLGDDDAEVWLMSLEAGPGRVEPTVIEGRAPENDVDVMLSRELSHDTGADIGDSVRLHLPTIESQLASRLEQPWDGPTSRSTTLHVVGIGVLPIGDGRVGIGASMTLDGLRLALGPTSSPALLRLVDHAAPTVLTSAVQDELGGDVTPAAVAAMSSEELVEHLVPRFEAQILVLDAHGPDKAVERAVAASAGTLSQEDLYQDPTPESIINLDLSQATRIPVAFGGLMALIGVAVIAVLLATGGRLRREELAILRALGFGSRHVRWALAAQALTTVVAASVLAPVGILAGRSAWLSYAAGLGVAPEASVSSWGIAACISALLAVSLFVGALVAQVHTRGRLVALLRPAE
ncbi:MAG: FtsX-like permease family protein, partial [Acidimicrobiales bacterium]